MKLNLTVGRTQERGTALLVALSCVLVLGILGAMATDMLRQRTFASQREVNQRVAQKLAEGGIERALSWFTLAANMSATSLPSLISSYSVSEGHVDVALDVANGVMTATGNVKGVQASRRLLFKVATATTPVTFDTALVAGCGILTDWDITGNGDAGLRGNVDVRVHSNHLLDIKNINTFAQKVASSTAACADISKVKSGPTPQLKQMANVPIPLLNWAKFQSEASAKTFSYHDSTQGGRLITRSNLFQTAADFVNVVNVSGGALTVTGPVYIKSGPLTCNSFSISGGPLIVEGDVDIRITGNGLISITNVGNYPVSIAWKGGLMYFGGNSKSTFSGYLYAETGGSMDFKGTSFQVTGGLILRGIPADGSSSLNLNGTPDLCLAKMNETQLGNYFVGTGTPTTTTTFTLYAWQ